MPYINIRITKEGKTPTKAQKEALISGVTELFEQVLGRSGKNAVVIIDEVSTDNYGIGGESVTQKRQKEAIKC